jgi:SAM-dependent methyltransferase
MASVARHCPICESEAVISYSLKADFICNQLEKYYGAKPPATANIVDYHMLSCSKCSLQFADPPLPGNPSFYEWVSKQTRYYPTARWEWNAALENLRRHNNGPVSLLDFGCGEGDFLLLANQLTNVTGLGFDSTEASVQVCHERGLHAYHGTVEEFLNDRLSADDRFDVITLFQVLEHVGDPKVLLKSLLVLLKPTGRMLVSTPYSPMSFEEAWFDPLNHPPHHLTRWNIRAYEELGHQLSLQLQVTMPAPAPILKRALVGQNLAWHGPFGRTSRGKLFAKTLIHPVATLTQIVRQAARERVIGRAAADLVLAEFFRN